MCSQLPGRLVRRVDLFRVEKPVTGTRRRRPAQTRGAGDTDHVGDWTPAYAGVTDAAAGVTDAAAGVPDADAGVKTMITERTIVIPADAGIQSVGGRSIIGDRIPLAMGVAILYFGFRTTDWRVLVGFFAAMVVPLVATMEHRQGVAIALNYLSRVHLPDPSDEMPE